jgi:hypothetical protein
MSRELNGRVLAFNDNAVVLNVAWSSPPKQWAAWLLRSQIKEERNNALLQELRTNHIETTFTVTGDVIYLHPI